MKWLVAALAAGFGAWLFFFASAHAGGAAGVRSDEGAYRMRLCELALWAGESARSDRLLEPRDGQAVAYGSFAPAASAFVLARILPGSTLDLERGELDEDALASGAVGFWYCLAWLLSFGLALAGRCFVEPRPAGRAAHVIGWLAALVWTGFALLPSSDGGAVRHEIWGLALGAGILAASALLSRARGLLDQLALGIGSGVLVGLALCNDPFAWPLLFAPLLAAVIAGRAQQGALWRDRLRSALFFLTTALFVAGQGGPWSWHTLPLPAFDLAWQTRAGVLDQPWIDLACAALVAWLVLGCALLAERKLLALFLVSTLVLRVLDARFAATPLAPAGCALVACMVTIWRTRPVSVLRRAAACGALALMCWAAAGGPRGRHEAALIGALRELRTLTRSSGAWNHGGARQEYALLANPQLAGSVAFHARRPLAGALLPGTRAPSAAHVAADALLSSDAEQLAARANALNAPYVLVTRRDGELLDELVELSGRRVPDLDPGRALVLRELLLRERLDGFELLLRVPAAPDGLPALVAVWGLRAPATPRAPASMRAR